MGLRSRRPALDLIVPLPYPLVPPLSPPLPDHLHLFQRRLVGCRALDLHPAAVRVQPSPARHQGPVTEQILDQLYLVVPALLRVNPTLHCPALPWQPRDHVGHAILADVGVDLRSGQAHVPEQRLDVDQLGAGLQ